MVNEKPLTVAQQPIASRLWLGSSLYPSPSIMAQAIAAAEPGMVTVSLRRQTAQQLTDNDHWHYLRQHLQHSQCRLLPNTAGCHSADEAVLLAHMARELFATSWIKLEVIGDDYNLQPHPVELLKAAERLLSDGFTVLPYCTDDLVLCRELHQLGCAAVMPWGAPIGTGRGLQHRHQLQQLRERLPEAVLVIDAGIGRPSQAMAAMEMGFDAVLLNTAVAKAQDPVMMAQAFASAVAAGRQAYLAGPMVEQNQASASTPTLGMPFWHQVAADD